MSGQKGEWESSKTYGRIITGGHSIKNDLGDIKLLPNEDNMDKMSCRSVNLGSMG